MLAPDPPMTRSSACHHAAELSVTDPLEFRSFQEMTLALMAAVLPPGAAALLSGVHVVALSNNLYQK